jgi:ADP-heptose:LPS heptosyltransferase
MWSLETSKGFEVRKCRERVAEYLHGTVLDFGCGDEKVFYNSIGIDQHGKAADLKLDLSNIKSYKFFGDKSADVIFSSHFLEDIIDYQSILKEFWRILKPEGHLILYLPHKDFYPNVGQTGANPCHKHDFLPKDILGAIEECGSSKIVSCETFSDTDEYSFQIVAQKLDLPVKINIYEKSAPWQKKTVCIIRYGGYGDCLYATPIFRLFKEQGYKVIFNTTPANLPVVENNPYIDEFHLQTRYTIPTDKLKEYFEVLKKKYNNIVNLCESVERTLLIEERDVDKYNMSHEERHRLCDINYYDRTLATSGLPNRGCNPEIYLSENETRLCEYFQKKYKGFFKIQWQLTGSSWHKLYPYSDQVIDRLIDLHPDIKVFLTGGEVARISAWGSPNVINKIGIWDIRQSMIMTKFMDLVVSPETGVLNASGAFDTPKIGLLTHSSKENLTKYFKNDYSIQSESNCSPCHRLADTLEKCPLDNEYGLPICTSKGINPDKLFNTIEQLYLKWRK